MDDESLQDADEMIELLRAAHRAGVVYEVAATFLDELHRGSTVREACHVAARDWDV